MGREGNKIDMKDFGQIELAVDEQVTFVTESGSEYDLARKSWGFYATPSLNNRLGRFGLRPLLVRSPGKLYYVFLLEKGKEAELERYLHEEGHDIICWLDDPASLEKIERASPPKPLTKAGEQAC